MTILLHISSSPRGAASESLAIANAFLDTYRAAHPGVAIDTFDLWDGSLPAFGPAAAAAKMTVLGGFAYPLKKVHYGPSTSSTIGRCAKCRTMSGRSIG